MCSFSLKTSIAPLMETNLVFSSSRSKLLLPTENKLTLTRIRIAASPLIMCCSNSNSSFSTTTTATTPNMGPPVIKKRKRYRKPYPGEKKGITEEMRFVAMRLRNLKGKYTHKSINSDDDDDSQNSENDDVSDEEEGVESWVPSIEGFVKYLVDSKLVFDTVERIVDKSDDVSYTYFRRTGLERSESLAEDLEWFSQKDIPIPEPTASGVSYANYLEELAEKSAPLFLCHFYNIYFSHIAGSQVIARQVSEKILEGRELEFYRWEGDVQELLKGTRENLNMLGEHWSRDVKNKCLKEATKSFRYLGQIVRLIIS